MQAMVISVSAAHAMDMQSPNHSNSSTMGIPSDTATKNNVISAWTTFAFASMLPELVCQAGVVNRLAIDQPRSGSLLPPTPYALKWMPSAIALEGAA